MNAMLETYQRAAAGGALRVQLQLTNTSASTTAYVTYDVLTPNGSIVTEDHATYAVHGTRTETYTVQLPPHIPAGTYTMRASIAYAGSGSPTQSSEYTFIVQPAFSGVFLSDDLWILSIPLVLAIFCLVYIHHRRTKRPR